MTTRWARADPSASSQTSPKRQVPDYRGRRPLVKTTGSAALWLPRVILSPLYLLSEYGIRAPLAIMVPAAERAEVPRKLYDFFAFGPDHKAGVVPVAYFDFGLNPSVGVSGFWNDAFAGGNDWSVHAEVWPTSWYAMSLKEGARIDAEHTLLFQLSGLHRPDRVFYGIGPRTLQSSQSRYTEARADENVTLDWKYLRASHLQLTVGLRSESPGPGAYDRDPSLQQEAATGAFAVPYGYDLRQTAEYNRVQAWYDSRHPWPESGSGVRIEAKAEQGSDMIARSGWIRYGTTVTGSVDLDQHQHVISLVAAVELADPLGERPVPFTELVALGGDGPMRGYLPRRLLDRSAAVAALHYVWPIAPWLGGDIELAAGNVFGEHLVGFRPDLLRFSGDIGITTLGVSEYPVQTIIGVGSETFAQGGAIDSVRAALLVNHGF
jgi:hypothetical protein